MPVAIWLVTLYPRAWRRRYEAEMLALLEQHRVTLVTVLDLLFGMISARLNPQYRDDPGPVLFTSPPAATWKALAAWGAFVLCVAAYSGPLYLGMVFLLTGQRELPWPYFNGSILAMSGPGIPEPAVISTVVGGNLWYAEPAIVLLPFFAMTALVSLGCLRWAVRTRHVGIIVLTIVWFAVPVAITLWLVAALQDIPYLLSLLQPYFPPSMFPASPARPIFMALFQFFSSLPVSLLTTLGELEALMGVVFLSVWRACRALRTQRYGLLGLVVGVDLALILIAVYIVKSWDLFTPHTFTPYTPPDASRYNQGFFTIEALGLCAHLLPFAAVALPLLALGGSALGKQRWQAVVVGVSLLAVLMAVCDVCFLVGMLITWPGIGIAPEFWNQGGMDQWYVAVFITGGAIVATLAFSLLAVLRALRSMVAAGTTAAPALRVPA